MIINKMIDFHTHIFPDKLAPRAISHLSEISGLPAFTDGTLGGLLESMKRAGIARSVLLPVLTRPEQFESVNRYSASLLGVAGLVPFGGIHPDCADVDDKVASVCRLGLRGLKVHPDFQGVPIDDARYTRLISAAVARGLYVTAHAGLDLGFPDTVNCPPARAACMLDAVGERGEPHVVLAHAGGWRCWDDVERHLVGRNVLFDISACLPYMPQEQLVRIICAHGPRRILFGTDSPWDDQADDVARFWRLPLPQEELRLIASENAKRILSLYDL